MVAKWNVWGNQSTDYGVCTSVNFFQWYLRSGSATRLGARRGRAFGGEVQKTSTRRVAIMSAMGSEEYLKQVTWMMEPTVTGSIQKEIGI